MLEEKNKRGANDWKCIAWDLERIFPEEFGRPDRDTNISLTQNNNTLNLMDGNALQEARRMLDEVQAEKAARRQPIEAETTDAELVSEPAPEPLPQSADKRSLLKQDVWAATTGTEKEFFDRRAVHPFPLTVALERR